MKRDEALLAARLKEELGDLEQVVERAERLMLKAQERCDEDYLDGVALNLQSFYTGVERVFEEIAREVDSSVPSGSEWHRDLLIQMSAEIPGTRPRIISRELRGYLDDYRGFRHVVRNVYSFNLVPSRLQELASSLRPCYARLVAEISSFCDLLLKLEQQEI